jgi:ribonuclease BN (tRNA processing enzyme)
VRITVLGCSGSVVGPDSPASGYLLTAPDTKPLVLDFGGGVLGALQRYVNPNDVDVLLSHLHADHCLDLPGLFVWRRYHPTPATERGVMCGPSDTWTRLAAASSPLGGDLDDFTDIFEVREWVDGEAVQIGALSVLPRLVSHPTESYGLRITDPTGFFPLVTAMDQTVQKGPGCHDNSPSFDLGAISQRHAGQPIPVNNQTRNFCGSQGQIFCFCQ